MYPYRAVVSKGNTIDLGLLFHNLVEQDHRFIENRVRSMLGLKSLRTVHCILSGVEAMHMIRKGQLHQRVKSARNEAEFIHKLFELVV